MHISESSTVEKPYNIVFNVDMKLTLNITFLLLKFYLELDLCGSSGIKILDKNPNIDNNTYSEYVYCKQYATFNFYPKFNQVYITTGTNDYGNIYPFQMSFQFSVTDNKVIKSKIHKLFPQTSLPNVFDFHCYKMYRHFLMVSCLIKVSKLYQIFMSSSSDLKSFTIYDGPGFIFPVLKSSKSFIATSTFQCIVQTLITQNSYIEIKQFSFAVKPKTAVKYLNAKDKITFLNFAGECLSSVCVTHIITTNGCQVNLTINGISLNNQLNLGCLFWGLVVTEEFNNTFEESTILCEQFNQNTSPSRSFYSSNSSLFLIIYNYSVQGNSSVYGSISKTRCKPFHLDPCELIYHYCDSMESAKWYILGITRFSDIHFSVNDILPVFDEEKVDLFVKLKGNTCIVIQIGNRDKKERLPNMQLLWRCWFFSTTCPFQISLKNMGTIMFSIKGDLKFATGNMFSEANIYYMPCTESSAVKLVKNEFRKHKMNDSIKVFGQISSVKISVARRSTQWMDIAVINAKSSQYENSVQAMYQLKYINKFDVIAEYGPMLFSNLDININIVKKNSHSTSLPKPSKMMISILAGHILFHHGKQIMQKQGEHINIYIGYCGIYNITYKCHRLHDDISEIWWESTFSSSSYYSLREMYVSLPGTLLRINLRISTEVKLQKLYAVVNWFIRKHHTIHYKTRCTYNNLYCKFTPLDASNSLNTYYLYGNISKFYQYIPQHLELKSWENATEFCNSVGGHLPVFGSKNELDEFIALLRFSNHLPPLEAIYIGLKYSDYKVSFR